ncbi:hypothetical protein [Methanomassiliicoccus luminyensis]|uniref:hypothetical protein n=1 Tax=Methanomassiliicoccus luminyensis TaxID=1080712 RepID=UPI0011CCA979|nr:hypothetical protein [Methanomassiliicoccus luminyensis]
MSKAEVLAQVEERLTLFRGLKGLRFVDAGFKRGLEDMERQAETQSKEAGLMRVINEGFWNTMDRDVQVALVLTPDNYLIRRSNDLLKLKDGGGNLLGEWINPERAEEMKEREDVRFISHDFVLYKGADMEGEPYFVLPDVDFLYLEGVEGICNITSSSPSGPADEYIRKELGLDEPRLMSHLIGFDIVED